MHGPTIAADDLEAWARTPLEHSLGGIAPGERVMIKGKRIAWPLMAVLERGVVEAGGIPDVLLVEKVGGTLHVAIGRSYDHAYVEESGSEEGARRLAELEREGVMNRSAQHVDIVADVRPRGCGRRVFIDDTEIVVPNRVWVPRREPAGPGDPARVATSIGTERGIATC